MTWDGNWPGVATPTRGPTTPPTTTRSRLWPLPLLNYLTNNRERMDYPAYRQAGMPVTTAWMESLVKEINWRVKGTEMFGNHPEGAEALLQIRATALRDDARLKPHLQTRPGSPFTRRPNPPTLPRRKIKS